VQTRSLGSTQVGCVGFGGAPVSLRPDRPSDDEGVRVVHAALDAGMTLFDTADVYTPAGTGRGHSERLIARALRERGRRAGDVLVATKGGKYWDAAGDVQIDASPDQLRAACEASLLALETDVIDLYQLHEVDPVVPLEDSVGTLAALQREGKIARIGLCNVTVEEVDRALAVAPIVSVQNRYSPAVTDSDPVLDRCAALGISFLPWGPLTGFRPGDPKTPVQDRFAAVAGRMGVSVQRVVLAWELARSPAMLPIPGSTRVSTVADSAAAADLPLSIQDVAWLAGETTVAAP
jgi:aryl-alcohol dehydrogenase-like predicted oxidoreductase